jgi:hypothetical protein
MGRPDDATMPTATHPPETDAGGVAATVDHGAVARLGGASVGSSRSPSGDLLPSDGTLARDPALAPTRVLALDAVRLLRRWHAHPPAPDPWSDPRFLADVDAVRGQLQPIRTRRALAESFAREASRLTPAEPSAEAGPVRLAYALRWSELRR